MHDWNHNVLLSREENQLTMTTTDLIKLFSKLEKAGYNALSVGLIIDLVLREAK
jgi:hypothetical protein